MITFARSVRGDLGEGRTCTSWAWDSRKVLAAPQHNWTNGAVLASLALAAVALLAPSPAAADGGLGAQWVQHGALPAPSTQLLASEGNKLDRDANGKAISVGPSGPVPRLPIIELGEARFISGFTGSYDGVKTIQELGFANHQAYLKAFAKRVADYVKANYMLNEDATAMRKRAALCPPLTFTETYRDRYGAFTTMVPCGP